MGIMGFRNKRIADDAINNENSAAMPTDMGSVAVAKSLEDSAVPVSGYDVAATRVGKERLAEAWNTMLEYKSHKKNLEQRIIDNQQWYKLRQWECMRVKEHSDVEPASGWLFNAIANKHADAMDNFPSINILPREEGDKGEARMLSSIVPVVLEQNDFEQVYSDHVDSKLIAGTGVYGVFWDKDKLNGLGDIDIEEIDVINLFWESGITDIQQSRNLFYVSLRDNDLLEAEYPQFKGKLSATVLDIAKYVYDDSIDTTKKTVVVDWYYKVRQEGRTVLHYCKFIAGQEEPIFATENEAEYRNGWYDHGEYPFVFDPMFRCKGTPCGFSYIDVGKKTQEYIDRGDQAILQNMLFNASPRHFIRNDGSVNEEEYADVTKPLVHVDGQLGQDSITPIQSNSLNDIYVTIINNKITELKEITGNRDVSTGGTTGGATAASAIAAMQEAGSKLSRDANKAGYRAFRQVTLLAIELIRQFYDTSRCFRITGQNGAEEFVQYSNAGILPQPQGEIQNGVPMEMGVEVGYRLPLFDIKVSPEKASPYSKLAQNELALQFYQAGFFAPEMAQSALVCLEMMDFDQKDFVTQNIQRNAMMYQQMQMAQARAMQMAQMMDSATGSGIAPQLAAELGTAPTGIPPQGAAKGAAEAVNGTAAPEPSVTKNARARTADATAPR